MRRADSAMDRLKQILFSVLLTDVLAKIMSFSQCAMRILFYRFQTKNAL